MKLLRYFLNILLLASLSLSVSNAESLIIEKLDGNWKCIPEQTLDYLTRHLPGAKHNLNDEQKNEIIEMLGSYTIQMDSKNLQVRRAFGGGVPSTENFSVRGITENSLVVQIEDSEDPEVFELQSDNTMVNYTVGLPMKRYFMERVR